jgi:choice-of-anchor C domain-containing protein
LANTIGSFRAAIVACILLLLVSVAQAQTYQWKVYNGHRYALTVKRAAWTELQAEAVAQGGHLVAINDDAENEWLIEAFRDTYVLGYDGDPSGAAASIGLFKDTDGSYKWINGEPFVYDRLVNKGGPYAYLHVKPWTIGPEYPVGTWGGNPAHTVGPNFAYGIIEAPLGPFRNGGFEHASTNPYLSQELPRGDTSLDGWAVVGQGIDYVNYMVWQPSEGGKSLDLSGSAAGGVEQTFQTEPGKTYEVLFDLAGNFSTSGVKTVRVTAADSSQDFGFDASGRTATDMGWATKRFVFTAIAASTTLRFESLSAEAAGPALDNVRLFRMGADALFVAAGSGVAAYDSSTLQLIRYFPVVGAGTVRGVAIGPDGVLYAGYNGAAYSGRIARFDSVTGQFLGEFALGVDASFNFTVGPDGNIYHADAIWARGIHKFSGTTGALLETWHRPFDGYNEAYTDVEFAANGTLLAWDANLHRVYRFSATGAYLGVVVDRYMGDGVFGFARDFADNIYVQAETGFFHKYSPAGIHLGQFTNKRGVNAFGAGFSSDGKFFETVYAAARQYDSDGNYLASFSGEGYLDFARNPGSDTRAPSNLKFATSSVASGKTVGVTLTVPGSLWYDADVSLKTTDGSVPARIFVPRGTRTASFNLTAPKLDVAKLVTVTATLNGKSVSASVRVAPAVPSYFTPSPTSVNGGSSVSLKLYLTGVAGPSGLTVSLSSDQASATVPATATVPAGQSSVTVKVSTTAVTADTLATISATAAARTATAKVTVLAPPGQPASLSPSPLSGTGGYAYTMQVNLSAAAKAGGLAVALASSNPGVASVPGSVTVAEGQTSGTFTVSTTAVAANTPLTISASANGKTVSGSMTVLAPVVKTISVSPTTVAPGVRSTLTIGLTGPAPAGGVNVSLSSTNSAVVPVPATLFIAEGLTKKGYSILTGSGIVDRVDATIAATLGNRKSVVLSVVPAGERYRIEPVDPDRGVDDDLLIYLRGKEIYRDENRTSSYLPTLTFYGNPGDALRFVASDNNGGSCYSIGQIRLVRLRDGYSTVLNEAITHCGEYNSPPVFFDRTYSLP